MFGCWGVPACPPPTNNNVDCEPTDLVREATITVDKVDDVVTNVVPGGTFSYALSVTNNGPSTVTDVVLDDDLPVGLSLVGATGSNWSCNNIDPLHCTYAARCGRDGLDLGPHRDGEVVECVRW